MRRLILVAGLLAAASCAGTSGAARAEGGAWCQTDIELTIVNCSYASLEQCQATVHGVGGLCLRNPASPPAPPQSRAPVRRRH